MLACPLQWFSLLWSWSSSTFLMLFNDDGDGGNDMPFQSSILCMHIYIYMCVCVRARIFNLCVWLLMMVMMLSMPVFRKIDSPLTLSNFDTPLMATLPFCVLLLLMMTTASFVWLVGPILLLWWLLLLSIGCCCRSYDIALAMAGLWFELTMPVMPLQYVCAPMRNDLTIHGCWYHFQTTL